MVKYTFSSESLGKIWICYQEHLDDRRALELSFARHDYSPTLEAS
jgi:hypothetical protein